MRDAAVRMLTDTTVRMIDLMSGHPIISAVTGVVVVAFIVVDEMRKPRRGMHR